MGGIDRVAYATSVHDQAEIDAVMSVLTGPEAGLRIGRRVARFERRIAELFGKASGVMCNSGSSALYLAVELLGLEPGDEVLTSVVTFSTDIAPLVRAGLVPVFVDVEPDTYCVDPEALERLIGPRTRAMLIPNLVGNAPDWDRLREIADRHGLAVIEDSCDAIGPRLRGTPTGTRADITVTSFSLSHIITCAGNGGMVLLDDEALRDRCLLLRRWGRRSELQFYGSRKGERDFFEPLPDGLVYDSLFIFDELGWNFEPSELGAAFGLAQLDKLDGFLATRQRNFAAHQQFFGAHAEVFVPPRQTDGVETGWLGYPVMLRPEAGIVRGELQAFLEQRRIDCRMVWTGNALRQPAFADIERRTDPAGYPNADRVMETALLLPCSHGNTPEEISYVHECIDEFLAAR